MTKVLATMKYVRISSRKARLVARNVRGLPVEQAMNILKFTPKKAAAIINEVLHSAVSNAEHNNSLNVDSLVVRDVIVNDGPSWKRWMPRSMGRVNRIVKRTSHITVIVEQS